MNSENFKSLRSFFRKPDKLFLLASQGVFPTLPIEQYDAMASTLYHAMVGYGTDVDTIFIIFKRIENAADIEKLNLAFGFRHFSPFSLSDLFPTDLRCWIKYSLDTSEIKYLNFILQEKGIPPFA